MGYAGYNPPRGPLIDGVDQISAEHINDLQAAIQEIQEFSLPRDTLVQCEYCESWGVLGFNCPQCGAPIDPTRSKRIVRRESPRDTFYALHGSTDGFRHSIGLAEEME